MWRRFVNISVHPVATSCTVMALTVLITAGLVIKTRSTGTQAISSYYLNNGISLSPVRDVNETLANETETRPRHLFFGPRRDRDQDLARPRPRRFSRPSMLNTDAHTNSPIQRHQNRFSASTHSWRNRAHKLWRSTAWRTDKQTDRRIDGQKTQHFCLPRRRLKSEPHQTWLGDRGRWPRSCTSITFGVRRSFAGVETKVETDLQTVAPHFGFKRMYVQFCNEAKSCAYWLVDETLWHETKTRPRRLETTSRDRLETETTSLAVNQ